MSLNLQCYTGPDPSWCPTSTDDALQSVIGLMPPGPTFSGVKVAGSEQNQYWRAFSSVLSFTYQRLCAYVDEFYCKTVNESLDQWIAEYGLDDECDPYGHNLCVKVAAQGGTTCDYFVQLALLSGWVITCEDASKWPEPIAGCFEVGCTPLGPTPTYNPYGGRIGVAQQQFCDYGEVTGHPDVAFWRHGQTAGAVCPVPGSNLGQGPDTDESCCFICGWYEVPTNQLADRTDYCSVVENVITFDCPSTHMSPDNPPTMWTSDQGYRDNTGNYTEWGHAFTWNVTVNMAQSWAHQVAQSIPAPDTETFAAAGNFMVGDIPGLYAGDPVGGSPLCSDFPSNGSTGFALCFLERVKPAHTNLNFTVVQS